jgi:hypothetical protein
VIGVRTGAPFIQDGVTGVFIDRLPPGAKRFKNDADEVALATFLEAVRVAHRMDRREVFASATREFDTKRLGQQIVTALESARMAQTVRSHMSLSAE